MRALARFSPATDGTARHLDLLRALWLLGFPESIRPAIPNKVEIDKNDLQQQADRLVDFLMASPRPINTVASDTPPLFLDAEVDTAATHRLLYSEPNKYQRNSTTPRSHD